MELHFKKLSYELGVLLCRSRTTEENANFLGIVNSIGYDRLFMDEFKKGYKFEYIVRNETDKDLERAFCTKFEELNLKIIRKIPITTTGESIFEYIGKRVILTEKPKRHRREEISWKGEILNIKYEPITGGYHISFLSDVDRGAYKNGLLYYESSVRVTPL